MFDAIIGNAKEIMYLLVGVSVFIISVSFVQALIPAIQILKRVNRVTATVEEYLQKPIMLLKQADAFLSRFF